MEEFGIHQGVKGGYRYGIDPFLLADFCQIRRGETVVDLGTGTGVIPLLLARRNPPPEKVVALEIQPGLVAMARKNLEQQGSAGLVEVLEGDLRRIGDLLPPQSARVVVSNPPYRKPGSGRQAPGEERARARHELAGGLEDFLGAAAYLLPDGGRLYLIYLAERLTELLDEMRGAGIEPKRLRCVHGRAGDAAKMVLVEGCRRGRPGLKIEAPLFVYEGEGYSAEVRRIYGEGG